MRHKTSMDTYSAPLSQHGPVTVWGNKYWHHPWYARNVLCPDSRRRTVYFTNSGDYYDVRCKYNGKWHKGFLSQIPNDAALSSTELDLEFIERTAN